jgi:hypothetical protein
MLQLVTLPHEELTALHITGRQRRSGRRTRSRGRKGPRKMSATTPRLKADVSSSVSVIQLGLLCYDMAKRTACLVLAIRLLPIDSSH